MLKWRKGLKKLRRKKMDKIKANLKFDGTGKVFLNGKDISNSVTGITITANAGEITKAEIRVSGNIEVEAEAKIKKVK
jgi:hypothetical protein